MKWLLILLLTLTACQKQVRPPLTVEAYVWQSADRPAVRDAMLRGEKSISTFHLRAAELKWTGDHFTIERPLTKLPSPNCGLVVRIGASAAQLDWTPQQIEPVANVFRELAKLHPTEIQCDYDCPQKRLDRYRVLLQALRSAAGKVPIFATALPTWLGESSFPRLVEGSGYILQVHSLQLPAREGDPVVIFDPASASAAARKASKLHIPFRIAMATYGCEVRFDAKGKVVNVISEGGGDPSPGKRAFALADPNESARLVREWTIQPPDGMTGIIWYRLPVEGDRRNWPWETFQSVIHGESATANLELIASPGPGARDLFVANRGKFPSRLPPEIIVTTPATAADGAGAYRLEVRENELHFFLTEDLWPWLDPGQKIPTGWLRNSDGSASIEWHLPP
jgi:hypothetical protein